jgi:hypothetical protein
VWAAFGNRRPRYAEWSEPDGFGISSPESVLRALTHDDDDLTVDYSAADLDGYADGDTVGTWPARRGGLDLSTVAGTPAYTAPDSTVRVPSVAYAASGERHEGPATLDWSAYGEATLLGVHYSESVSGISRGMSLAAGDEAIGAQAGRGLGTYRVDGKISSLVWTDEPEATSFWFERDNVADPAFVATVSVLDLQAGAQADIWRVYVNGVDQGGSTNGNDATQGNALPSDLRARLGAQDTNNNEGLDGRLVRFIACPRALSADQAVHASDLLATITRAH